MSATQFAQAVAREVRGPQGGIRLELEDDEVLVTLKARGSRERSLEDLRNADAKHRLAFALTRIAEIDIRRHRPQPAFKRAEEALRRAHDVLHHVGLGEAVYREVVEYSTGMRQRSRSTSKTSCESPFRIRKK